MFSRINTLFKAITSGFVGFFRDSLYFSITLATEKSYSMKTAISSLAPFNEPRITGPIHHSIRGWTFEISETTTGFNFCKFVNHHQYNIPGSTVSIIVAKAVANSVSFTKSFAYSNPENECRFTPFFPKIKQARLILKTDDA